MTEQPEFRTPEVQPVNTPPPPAIQPPPPPQAEANIFTKEVTPAVDYAPVSLPVPDEEAVAIVACENTITNIVGSASTHCVHVELNDHQRQLLKARMPRFDIRALFDMNKTLCPKIKVDQVKIDGPVASAEVTLDRYRSFSITYKCYLLKTSGWAVTNASGVRAVYSD